MTTDYHPVPLPVSEFVFGLCDHEQHIVTHGGASEALDLAGGDPRLASPPALCRRTVGLATAWGPYSRDEAMRHPHRCPDCAWILALNQGSVDAEIEAFTACDAIDAAAISDRVGDLGRHVLTAIAHDPTLTDGDQRLKPSHQSQLLGHATRHLPVVALCEECLEIGVANAHDGSSCPAQIVACAGCTLTSHEVWSGEWAGTFLPECTVTAPCSVLATIASHYQVPAAPR